MQKRYISIVFTGGPCAGKTTALHEIRKCLEKDNYIVVEINEIPTELVLSGLNKKICNEYYFKKSILELQIQKERIITNAIQLSPINNVIILLDRGVIDHFSYLNKNEINRIQKELNINMKEFYDDYDVVIHLSSTASALQKKYENNEYRKDTIIEASESDALLKRLWSEHSNYNYVPCYKNFNEKIKEIYNIIVNNYNYKFYK